MQSQNLVSFLPGNKYEQDTPAPLTRSRSASLHTVRPQGTTKEREKEKSEFGCNTWSSPTFRGEKRRRGTGNYRIESSIVNIYRLQLNVNVHRVVGGLY